VEIFGFSRQIFPLYFLKGNFGGKKITLQRSFSIAIERLSTHKIKAKIRNKHNKNAKTQ
jgi:hypothetical protein